MEAKKPRSAPSSPSRTPTTPNAWFEILNPDQASPFKGSQCFGASSELTFRTQDADVDADPFKCFSPSRVDDFGFDDDFFATYIDFEKLEEKEGNNGHDDKNDNLVDGEGSRRGGGRGRGRGKRKEKGNNAKTQPKKGQKRGSPGGQRSCLEGDGGLVEPRKAMAAKELAELWTIDPKRAKRNREHVGVLSSHRAQPNYGKSSIRSSLKREKGSICVGARGKGKDSSFRDEFADHTTRQHPEGDNRSCSRKVRP